jgi:hypothetical protein
MGNQTVWKLTCASCSNTDERNYNECDYTDNIYTIFSGLMASYGDSNYSFPVATPIQVKGKTITIGNAVIDTSLTDVKLFDSDGGFIVTDDFNTVLSYLKDCLCPVSVGNVPIQEQEQLIRVTPSDPFDENDPAFNCDLYTIPTTLYFGGTEFTPDFLWRVLSDGAGGCTITTIKSPTNPNVNPS